MSGWRSRLGVAENEFQDLKSYPQNTQNTQKPPEKEKMTPFADIADIAYVNSESTLKDFSSSSFNEFQDLKLPAQYTQNTQKPFGFDFKIGKLTDCLHGRKCKNLESKPPARPLCKVSGEPVFDLKQCPAGWWSSYRDGAVTEYILRPSH